MTFFQNLHEQGKDPQYKFFFAVNKNRLAVMPQSIIHSLQYSKPAFLAKVATQTVLVFL